MRNVQTLPQVKNIYNKSEFKQEVEDSVSSSSAIIRARFDADVKGVNRYKHFHRPISVQDNRQNNDKLSYGQFVCGCSAESIDKKISPRSPRNSHKSSTSSSSNQNLKIGKKRFIEFNTTKSANDLPIIRIQKSNQNLTSEFKNLQQYYQFRTNVQSPAIDTWRIRKRTVTSNNSDSIVQNGIIAMENMLNLKQLNTQNGPQIKKTENLSNINIILPQIQSQKSIKNEKQNKNIQEKKNLAIKYENSRPRDLFITQPKSNQIDSILLSPTVTITPDVSIVTIQQQKDTKKKTVPYLKKKKLEKTKSASTLKPMLNSHKKNNSSSKLSIETEECLNTKKINSNNFENKKKEELIKSKEFGTQTKYDIIFQQILAIINKNKMKNLLDEQTKLLVNKKIPKATQTDINLSHFAQKIDSFLERTVSELELTKLFEIIDNVLDETIDKKSKLLANHFIASSVQKQAQVWKDAKEFVSVLLIPCSIDLANKTRTAFMPIEKIAKIQLP